MSSTSQYIVVMILFLEPHLLTSVQKIKLEEEDNEVEMREEEE